MKKLISAAVAALLCLCSMSAEATTYYTHHKRSSEVTREFQRANPCPSTGKRSGACPGYIKDHIQALCKGGADAVWNMQWQTKADAAAKDKWECK
jgi:hypothetical protein